MLVERADRRRSLVARFAACFADGRDAVEELLRQRIFGIALGYEDLIDHDELRRDPLLAALGKSDPTGAERRQARDQGKALAGKSTLNWLKWSAVADGEEAVTGGCR